MKHIEVVAAIIFEGNKVFATQRGYGEWKDWWEFPGGKVEQGESPREALRREIREELERKYLLVICWKQYHTIIPIFTLRCIVMCVG